MHRNRYKCRKINYGIMAVEQIIVGHDNFSYLIYCEKEKLAALVDPGSNASQAMGIIGELNLDLKYVINTHYHKDHTRSNIRVKEAYDCMLISSHLDAEKIPEDVDQTVEDHEIMELGSVRMEFIHTPGHTPGGICIIVDGKYLLTGDTLFIGDCGRTDLPDGSNEQMFATLQMLKDLPDELIVYPGHDYGPRPSDTMGNQKKTNKTLLAKGLDEFSRIP